VVSLARALGEAWPRVPLGNKAFVAEFAMASTPHICHITIIHFVPSGRSSKPRAGDQTKMAAPDLDLIKQEKQATLLAWRRRRRLAATRQSAAIWSRASALLADPAVCIVVLDGKRLINRGQRILCSKL
jgi:hypothetical protein